MAKKGRLSNSCGHNGDLRTRWLAPVRLWWGVAGQADGFAVEEKDLHLS